MKLFRATADDIQTCQMAFGVRQFLGGWVFPQHHGEGRLVDGKPG